MPCNLVVLIIVHSFENVDFAILVSESATKEDKKEVDILPASYPRRSRRQARSLNIVGKSVSS
jgi:hypothetical protein